ncbi:MAG TPA: hypothetical protein VGR35_01360 [Tepidisphaeraceae bacterium]|nr:hypothetical protein [Tepidisphaeraceae bacterium]
MRHFALPNLNPFQDECVGIVERCGSRAPVDAEGEAEPTFVNLLYAGAILHNLVAPNPHVDVLWCLTWTDPICASTYLVSASVDDDDVPMRRPPRASVMARQEPTSSFTCSCEAASNFRISYATADEKLRQGCQILNALA